MDPKTFRAVRNRDNDYQIDREAQRTESFRGVRGIRDQDHAAQEGMGPIVDRTREHLGSADTARHSGAPAAPATGREWCA